LAASTSPSDADGNRRAMASGMVAATASGTVRLAGTVTAGRKAIETDPAVRSRESKTGPEGRRESTARNATVRSASDPGHVSAARRETVAGRGIEFTAPACLFGLARASTRKPRASCTQVAVAPSPPVPPGGPGVLAWA
jgi:hypothetical protein